MDQATQQLAESPALPEPVSTPDTLLTAEEVAALLQVTCAWVYAQTRRHQIPHLRLGRYVRYRRTAIETWIEDVERSSAIARRSSRRR
ncbi:MAG: helix-turn-helix domain-containing protein [Solirubrobacteraceae bacterium]